MLFANNSVILKYREEYLYSIIILNFFFFTDIHKIVKECTYNKMVKNSLYCVICVLIKFLS